MLSCCLPPPAAAAAVVVTGAGGGDAADAAATWFFLSLLYSAFLSYPYFYKFNNNPPSSPSLSGVKSVALRVLF